MSYKIIKYQIYQILFLISLLLSTKTALAQTGLPEDLRPRYIPNVRGVTAEEKIFSFTGNTIITIMQISGGIAVILIIYNGFQYAISRGEDSEIEKAKTNLLWIIGGLILMMTAYVIIRFVVQITLVAEEANL
jgi:hypothetical protein